MKFIVTTYSPQDERFGSLAFFDSYLEARSFVALASGKKAELLKKFPVMPKHVIENIMKKSITLPSALPIVDFKWIGHYNQIVDLFRISIYK